MQNIMEHDTEKLPPSPDVSLRAPSINHRPQPSSRFGTSTPSIQTQRAAVSSKLQPKAASYHESANSHGDDGFGVNEGHQYLQRSNLVAPTARGPSPPSVLDSDDGTSAPFIPILEKSSASAGGEGCSHASYIGTVTVNDSLIIENRRLTGSISTPSPGAVLHEQSMMSSNCVPVEGRLADLSDNETYSEDDNSEADGGGIVILDESPEDEYRQHHAQHSYSNTTSCIEPQIEYTQASMYENDSIVLAAAARVNANLLAAPPVLGNESLNFEQLLQEADDCHDETNRIDGAEEDIEGGIEKGGGETGDSSNMASQLFWQQGWFSFSSGKPAEPVQSRASRSTPLPTRTPVRATRICHDKYVVEIDIFPSNATNSSRLDIRDAIDVMGNVELLHLWFDPVPAVFDATVKDGSGSATSPSNSLDSDSSNGNNRQYDGQWVEISTPALRIPSDSRISGCLRAIRVRLRSMVGFPARIRSMIFVERNSGKMGMTLGPYPDQFMCSSGTMAYHQFSVRLSSGDEENGAGSTNGQRLVISDEVRLQRGGDDDGFNNTRRQCCVCSALRFLLGLLECLLCFRWYRPDLASYMQQTSKSLEKLRTLVERGESAAYAGGGDLIVDGGEEMETPLLGS